MPSILNPSFQVFVGGLSSQSTPESVATAFSAAGKVTKVQVRAHWRRAVALELDLFLAMLWDGNYCWDSASQPRHEALLQILQCHIVYLRLVCLF